MGTTAPPAKFTVDGDGSNSITTTALEHITNGYSSGVDSLRFGFNDGTYYYMGIQPYVVAGGNVGHKFTTANGGTTATALAVTGTGNVGVGTTSPGSALHIQRGSADAYLTIESTGGANYDQGIHFKDTAEDWYVGNKWDSPGNGFGIGRTSNKDDFVIDSSGNVGIGTTSPGYPLDCALNARAF